MIRNHIAGKFGDELSTIIEELLVCAESSEAGRNVYLCEAAEARGRQEVLAA